MFRSDSVLFFLSLSVGRWSAVARDFEKIQKSAFEKSVTEATGERAREATSVRRDETMQQAYNRFIQQCYEDNRLFLLRVEDAIEREVAKREGRPYRTREERERLKKEEKEKREKEEREAHRLKKNENERKRRKRRREEDPVAHEEYLEKRRQGERAMRVQEIAGGTYAPKRRHKTEKEMERRASTSASLAVRKVLGTRKRPKPTEADPVLARLYYRHQSTDLGSNVLPHEVVDSEKIGVLFASILSEVLHEWSETKKAFCKHGEKGEYQKEVGVRFLEKLSAWNADLGKYISDNGIQVAIMVKRRLQTQGRMVPHFDESLGPRYVLSPGPKEVLVHEKTLLVGPCYGMSSRARGSVPLKLELDDKNFWRAKHAVQQATSDVSLIMDFLPRQGEIPTYQGDLALLKLIERAAEGASGSLDFSFLEGLFKKPGE